jgi:hypothetical protein
MLLTFAHPYIMFMKAIDLFYSSITDRRWFPGNPDICETKGFTWLINSSKLKLHASDWQISFSAPAADFGDTQPSVPLMNIREKSKSIFSMKPAYHPF